MNSLLLRAGLAAAIIPLGIAAFAGSASAHTASALTTDAVCLNQTGAWKFNLTVTVTNPELNPVATIANSASPYTVHTFPYTTTFTETGKQATVRVTTVWSDGFKTDSGVLTVKAPAGGCVPATTVPAPTTTTTCSAAVPPRQDCGGVVPPPTVEPTTVVPPPDSTIPPVSSPVTPAPAAPTTAVRRASPTTAAAVAELPHTGAGNSPRNVAIAFAMTGLGIALVLVTRRRDRTVQ
jgi:hypothetical protein